MHNNQQQKKCIAIPQILIAYDQMCDYLDDFIHSHQENGILVEQVRLLRDYTALLGNQDDLFTHLMVRKEYENSRICLLCQNTYLVQAVTLAKKITESSDDFDEKIFQTLEVAFWDTDHIINAIGQYLGNNWGAEG